MNSTTKALVIIAITWHFLWSFGVVPWWTSIVTLVAGVGSTYTQYREMQKRKR